MPRPRKPSASRTPSSRTTAPDRTALDRDAEAVVAAVTAEARRALTASLDQMLTSELDRFQKQFARALTDLGIEAIAPEIGGFLVETFGGSVLGDAFAGSLGAALPEILGSGTVSPGQLGKAAVSAAKRGNLSRAQSASATVRTLGNGGRVL
jgi:hypothetical protein